MAYSSLQEAITASFYAWETRGRGWHTAPYPVELEPPYRPLLLLPSTGTAPSVIDDGKRHTALSWLVDRATAFVTGPAPIEEAASFEEQPPFRAFAPEPRQVFTLHIPPDADVADAVMGELIGALATAGQPTSFEVIGAVGVVSLQITCARSARHEVRALLDGYLPGIAATEGTDRLCDIWRTGTDARIVEFGLADEFFLPLRSGKHLGADPFVPLVAAFAHARAGECLVLQVLFTQTRNPWPRSIHDALDDGEGGCLIEDAPWFLPAATTKTATPLYAVAVRIGAQAGTAGRTADLLRGTHAFVRQYGEPLGNELVALAPGSITDDALHEAFVDRISYRTGMLLSAGELVGLVRVPGPSVQSRALARVSHRTTALPAVAEGHPYVLGTNHHRGVLTPATVDLESRFAHTWIIGASGTGKSTLLANLILGDIAAGHGVAVIEPHGDLIDDVIARLPASRRDDVILFDPADTECPIGFNVLEARSELDATLLSADLVGIFRRLATSWGDSMTTVLGRAVDALLTHPSGGTLVDLKRFLVEDRFRTETLAAIRDGDCVRFWREEYPVIGSRSIGPLLTRLDVFLRMRIIREIVGVAQGGLDLGRVMDDSAIVLCRLAKGQIGEENAHLLGSLLLAKLNQRALMRQAVPRDQRRPFFCYVDECQHFVSPSLEALATEGRKYRVGLVLAHQTLAQLSATPGIESALLANCHTRIAFRVGDEDAKRVSQGFANFGADDLRALARGEAIARIGSAADDFNLRTAPLARIDAEDADANLAALRATARTRFMNTRRAPTPPMAPPAPVEPVRPSADGETDRHAVPLAERTVSRPARPAPASPGRGGQMHKYLQHLVKRLAEERGFRASLEAPAGTGQVDVLLEREGLRVGCEVSVTTDVPHEAENLRKCIDAGFARVIVVSPERKLRVALSEFVRTSCPHAAIDIVAPEEIVAALDALGQPAIGETTVRGYKVKVTRQSRSPSQVAATREALAAVVARTLRK